MEGRTVVATYLGIDPGKSGGLAIIYPDCVEVHATPVSGSEYLEQEMARLIPALSTVRAAIEKQQAMPKQGVTSTFKTGEGFGLWRGMLAALCVPYDIVTPKQWRTAVGLPAGADKHQSVALAQRLFPSVAEQLVGPKGGIRDGLAEALLIAEARRRIG